MPVLNKGFGWRPQKPDGRDVFHLVRSVSLPPMVDLRPQCPAIRDQGQLGSCTAFACGGAFEFELLKEKKKDFEPSELFIYYCERSLEGTIAYDAGAEIRDGFKSMNKFGVCSSADWPYDINKFATKPSAKAYKDAKKDKAVKYAQVPQDAQTMKTVLEQGDPIVVGFTVYDSFMSDQVAQTGIVPMPDLSTESVQGGHAVVVVGYDDSKQWWIVRNSWSTSWGDAGYFYMPYQYFLDPNLSSDFWVATLVS